MDLSHSLIPPFPYRDSKNLSSSSLNPFTVYIYLDPGLYNLEVFEDHVEQKIERVDTIPRFSKILLKKRLKGLIQSQGLIILRFFDHAVHTRERAHNLEVFDLAVQTGERSKKLEWCIPWMLNETPILLCVLEYQEGMLSDLHQLTFMLFRSDERV
ncbi:unnamed protein product [Lactuca saligna]|uniref:Uncharacterized protein n=1 Tax=Lactuca saligna TaxID=75948 RepID=A0AA35ZTF9_LACSI|nr:unnamed protein product [Lactuca saligna]